MNLKCFLAAEKIKRNQPNYCTSYILCWVTESLVYQDSLTQQVGQNRNTNSIWGGGGKQHTETNPVCSSVEYKGIQDTISSWVTGEKKWAHYILIRPTATLSSTTISNKGWGKQSGANKKNGSLYRIKCQKTKEGKDIKTKNFYQISNVCKFVCTNNLWS